MSISRYRFFDDEVLDGTTMVNLHPLQNGYNNNQQNSNNRALLSTPTAPRTPEPPNRLVLKMLSDFEVISHYCYIGNKASRP
jgi:hypothetical protein